MQGAFSAAPLRALLAAGHSIVSVVVPERQADTDATAPPAADGTLRLGCCHDQFPLVRLQRPENYGRQPAKSIPQRTPRIAPH